MAYYNPVVVKEISKNSKIGMMSATYVSQQSCPLSCPFLNKGCYSENGPIGIITRGLNAHKASVVELAEMEAEGIDRLSGMNVLRLHCVGDCTTDKAAKIVSEACGRFMTRQMRRTGKKQKVYTYTHAHNVARESWGEVSVLRSCENMDQVKKADADGYAAELTVDEFKQETAYDLGDGYTGIPCPQQTGKAATCLDCGLCMIDQKLRASKRVILLAAHGQRKKMVKLTVVGQSSPKESFAYPAE